MSEGRHAGSQRSRRLELQRLLEAKGIDGYVLPRHEKGTLERPAQGWYVKLGDNRVEFLGDCFTLAVMRMDLVALAPAPARRNGTRRRAKAAA